MIIQENSKGPFRPERQKVDFDGGGVSHEEKLSTSPIPPATSQQTIREMEENRTDTSEAEDETEEGDTDDQALMVRK